MTPLELAMWIAILMECWSNGSVPAEPGELAKCLGWSTEDVNAGLTERVLSFFKEAGGELVSPKLEEHWQKHVARKAKQIEGGKEGAKRRYNKELKDAGTPIDQPTSTLIGQPIGQPIGSLNYIKSNSIKSNSVFKEEVIDDPWLSDYDSATSKQVKVRV
jgi:hypothetical protein